MKTKTQLSLDKTRDLRGFTLIELLVVIAIIGILSTVAIVNLNSARDKAKFAAAQAALSQMATPMILCMDEEVGGGTVTWNNPAVNTEPCTASSVDGSNFPNLGTGWTYGSTYYHYNST